MLEQELAAADPDLDQKLQGRLPSGRATRRTVYGALAALAGFALVIAGIITKLMLIGVIGFLLMVAGAYFVISEVRPQENSTKPPA